MRRFSGPVLRGYGSLRSEEEGKTLPVYENTFGGERRGEEFLAFYCGSPAFPDYYNSPKVFVPLPKAGSLRPHWGAVLACWGLTSP